MAWRQIEAEVVVPKNSHTVVPWVSASVAGYVGLTCLFTSHSLPFTLTMSPSFCQTFCGRGAQDSFLLSLALLHPFIDCCFFYPANCKPFADQLEPNEYIPLLRSSVYIESCVLARVSVRSQWRWSVCPREWFTEPIGSHASFLRTRETAFLAAASRLTSGLFSCSNRSQSWMAQRRVLASLPYFASFPIALFLMMLWHFDLVLVQLLILILMCIAVACRQSFFLCLDYILRFSCLLLYSVSVCFCFLFFNVATTLEYLENRWLLDTPEKLSSLFLLFLVMGQSSKTVVFLVKHVYHCLHCLLLFYLICLIYLRHLPLTTSDTAYWNTLYELFSFFIFFYFLFSFNFVDQFAVDRIGQQKQHPASVTVFVFVCCEMANQQSTHLLYSSNWGHIC